MLWAQAPNTAFNSKLSSDDSCGFDMGYKVWNPASPTAAGKRSDLKSKSPFAVPV
jgi:hypothetical protein